MRDKKHDQYATVEARRDKAAQRQRKRWDGVTPLERQAMSARGPFERGPSLAQPCIVCGDTKDVGLDRGQWRCGRHLGEWPVDA